MLYSGFRLHMGGPYPTSRSLEARSSARIADAPTAESTDLHAAPSELAREATADFINGVRIREWADHVASGPAALLVARPDPDGFAPSYPSAVAAYREMSEVIEAL